MKLTFNYGNAVAVLPQAVTEKIDKATKKDMKLLFLIAAEPSLLSLGDALAEELAQRSGMKKEDVSGAISFWRGAGILEETDKGESSASACTVTAEDENVIAEEPKKKLKSEDSLPRYSTEELTEILRKREDSRYLIDECQRLFGKVFNTAEINILMGLTDYLDLDSEYILLLFAHCGKMERRSLRTVERLAHRFLDEDITDAFTLGNRLRFIEQAEKTEAQVRRIFGITHRALTKKEKALIEKWLSEYNYDYEIIEKAYELTVDSTQKPSLPYAGAIMDRWFSEGLKSTEDIDRDIAERKNNKAPESGSFDTDEFLEAALKRSFEDK